MNKILGSRSIVAKDEPVRGGENECVMLEASPKLPTPDPLSRVTCTPMRHRTLVFIQVRAPVVDNGPDHQLDAGSACAAIFLQMFVFPQ